MEIKGIRECPLFVFIIIFILHSENFRYYYPGYYPHEKKDIIIKHI